MHLVLDARMVSHSGIGRYIRYLIPLLLDRKDISLTLLGNVSDLEIKYPGVDAVSIRSQIYSPVEQLELPGKIPSCDVFWSPHYNAPVFRTRARMTVATIHDLFPFSRFAAKAGMGFLKRAYARFLLKNAAVRTDRVIAVSKATRDELKIYVPAARKIPGRIDVIPHFADPVFGRRKKGAKMPKIIPGAGKRYLLYVGNIKPHKNIRGILGAFGMVLKKDPGLKLVIAGKKDGFITGMKDWDVLIDRLGIRDKVLFTGNLPDSELIALYGGALGLVFPSFYEGFGFPPLEAMACGCPVVASDIPPLRETCGDAAIYVNPFSIPDIARGIEKILDGKNRKKTATAGYRNVKRFAKADIVRKYNRFLDSLMNTEI